MAPWCWVQRAISNFRGLILHPAGLGISLKAHVALSNLRVNGPVYGYSLNIMLLLACRTL